jgi:hypothetical protein
MQSKLMGKNAFSGKRRRDWPAPYPLISAVTILAVV